MFGRGKRSLHSTCLLWQACAHIHNISINKRKDLVQFWEGEINDVAMRRFKKENFNGTPESTYVCPPDFTQAADKTEGDRRQKALIERADAREDLITYRAPRAERQERLEQRRVVDHELKCEDSDDY